MCYNRPVLAQTISWESGIRKLQRLALDGMVNNFPGLGLDKRAEFFVRIFENYLKPGSRVLDIGGGWGFYAAPLEKRGHELTVLDVVKPGLQKAPVVVYSGGKMPFENNAFDASLLVTMLHHTPDPEAILKEAARVTRDKLIVVEDLYHHALGRFWTILRDRFYNFEFFGHPCQFKNREEWLEVFRRLDFSLCGEERVYTNLAGMRILNGIFVLKKS